jgi:hypothetical protein
MTLLVAEEKCVMNNQRRIGILVAAAVSAAVLAGGAIASTSTGGAQTAKKPSLALRATPPVSFTPAKIFLLAEVKGGPDDYADLYCAAVEWDWDDDTKSESTLDCDPYEAGKSEIRRRFSIEHVYRSAGIYRVWIRLKQKDRVILAATATVQVNPGIRDPGEP